MSSDQFDAPDSFDGPDQDADYRRSWPFVLLGAGIALIIGFAIWAFWLGPGEPTVDTTSTTPTIVASSTPTTSLTPTRTSRPTPTPTSKPTATATPQPSDEVNNPIDDAIVGYPGKPLKRTSSTTPNDVVKVVQQRLVDLGFPVRVDGIFGSGTEAAVKKFQKGESLTVDGIVGRATWAALFTSEG